jgi:hypothetical protein
MSTEQSDVFSGFDEILKVAGTDLSPWVDDRYVPSLDLLKQLLELTLGTKQQSGRTAKALDAWIAHELRRAGYPADAVWPRTRRPRILPTELAPVETAIDEVVAAMQEHEKGGSKLEPERLRKAIKTLNERRLTRSDAYILGDFYAKQVDVVIASWRRGPEVLVSTKTMFSSYRNNLRNRHEEAVGEVSTLRRRHPMAAMGLAFMVRSDIAKGDYAVLRNIITRLRRPGETFDATMLLMADWEDENPAGTLKALNEPDPSLDAATFFEDLLAASTDRTPAGEHERVRTLRDGDPNDATPPEEGATEVSDETAL